MQNLKLTIKAILCVAMLAAFTACKEGKKGNQNEVNRSAITDSAKGTSDNVPGTSDTTQTTNPKTTTDNNTTDNNTADTVAKDPVTTTQPTGGGSYLNAKQVEVMLDKVDNVSFSSDKKKALMKVVRLDMTEKAQILTIDYVLANVAFGDDKVTLLKRIIQKDNFTAKVKKHMLNNLDELSFSSEREKILKILAE